MFGPFVSGLSGQRLSLPSGTRVRVWVAGEPTVGSVQSLGGDTLSVAVEGGGPLLVAPLAGIGGIEISRGTRRKTGTGAALGAVVGLLGGLAIGAAADPEYGAIVG